MLKDSINHIRRRLKIALSHSKPPSNWPTKGPRAIIALAADYGNLGDVALTVAAMKLAAKHLPNHTPYLLTASNIFNDLKSTSQASGDEDVILIVGGGNMGNRYTRLEQARVEVIRHFKRQRIISLPQSCDFSDDDAGRKAALVSAKAYAQHRNLVLFARDNASLLRMQNIFSNCRVSLAPDCVHLLQPHKPAQIGGTLVLLRMDQESGLGSEGRDRLTRFIVNNLQQTEFADTAYGSKGTFGFHEKKLREFLPIIASSNRIITDRLHGIIFSELHGISCIGIEGSNSKIRDYHETWLKHYPHLALVKRPEEAQKVLEDFPEQINQRVDFGDAFKTIECAIKGEFKTI